MAIRRLPDGSLLFDTVEQAAEYEIAIKQRAGSQLFDETEAKLLNVIRNLKGNGPKFIAEIVNAGAAGIYMSELRDRLGITDARGLGGVRGAIGKNLNNAGIDHDQVIVVSGDRYIAGPLLRRIGPTLQT